MHRCLMRRFFRCFRPKNGHHLNLKSLRMVILTIILVQVLCCHSITKITQNGIKGAMFVSHESRPWRRGTSRTAGGSNGGKRSIRRTGVYTKETTTTEGKRWDEGRRWTSSCHPCRCYMGSIVCFWKSVMIVHVVIAEQIDLRRRTTTNKYLLLFPSSLNYACHLHSDQLHACLYPWDAYLIGFFLLFISLINQRVIQKSMMILMREICHMASNVVISTNAPFIWCIIY